MAEFLTITSLRCRFYFLHDDFLYKVSGCVHLVPEKNVIVKHALSEFLLTFSWILFIPTAQLVYIN